MIYWRKNRIFVYFYLVDKSYLYIYLLSHLCTWKFFLACRHLLFHCVLPNASFLVDFISPSIRRREQHCYYNARTLQSKFVLKQTLFLLFLNTSNLRAVTLLLLSRLVHLLEVKTHGDLLKGCYCASPLTMTGDASLPKLYKKVWRIILTCWHQIYCLDFLA